LASMVCFARKLELINTKDNANMLANIYLIAIIAMGLLTLIAPLISQDKPNDYEQF